MSGTVFIMRGVPGSGKSTLAQALVGSRVHICSADDFFLGPDGSYNWDPKLLHLAHKECQRKLICLMAEGVSVIAVDNTHCQQEHFDRARELVERYGYTAVEVAFLPPEGNAALAGYVDSCAARNVHNVPREAILRMAFQLRDGKHIGGPVPKIRISEDTGTCWLGENFFESVSKAIRACETGELGVVPYNDERFMNRLYEMEEALLAVPA